MSNDENIKELLKDLFENKLNIKQHSKEHIQKIMFPYTNFEDYRKYGNMFLKLKNKK